MNKVGRYFLNIALGLDQLGNTFLGGSPDETISSRLGRIKEANGGKIPWTRPWPRVMDWFLDKIQKDHCRFIAFDAFGPVCTNPDKRSPRYCPFAKDERHECRWLQDFNEWLSRQKVVAHE